MSAISDPGVAAEGHLVVRQLSDLGEVLRLKRKIRRLELALPELDPRERAMAEARLARQLGACGCTEGAVGLMIGLSFGIAFAVLDAPGFRDWALILMITCCGAAMGKVFGLWRARKGLKAEIARLQTEFA